MTLLQGFIWFLGMLVAFLWGAYRYYSDGYNHGWEACQDALQEEIKRIKNMTYDEVMEELDALRAENKNENE
jgi:hypothetical protein